MSRLIIEMPDGTGDIEEPFILAAFLMNIVAAIAIAIYLNGKYLGKFDDYIQVGLCALFVIAYMVLSFQPYISFLIGIVSIVVCCILLFPLIDKIFSGKIRLVTKVILVLLGVLFEWAQGTMVTT